MMSTTTTSSSSSSASSSLSSNDAAVMAARKKAKQSIIPKSAQQQPPPVFGSSPPAEHHHHNNNNMSSFNTQTTASDSSNNTIDFRQDLNLLHENAKLSLDRTRQFYEQELAQRDEYIQRLGSDFQHNLQAAQGLEQECDRLKSEVEEFSRLEVKNEETIKSLAETNGALTAQNDRLKEELDESLKKYDSAMQKARSEITSAKQSAEAEKAKRTGEFTARESSLEETHIREMSQLKEEHEDAIRMMNERQQQLEREQKLLEDKVSTLERKLASSNAEKTSLQHSLQVSKRREEEAENRNRQLLAHQDETAMEISRLRDENISLCVERDSKKSELESTVSSNDRSFSQRLSQMNGELTRIQNSEKSLKDLVENLKGQLQDERGLRRKETDEAEIRLLEMRKQVEEAREAAHGTASSSQKEAHDERRKIMEELNDQIAETLKQTRRADDLDRRVQQATFEQSLSKQRIESLAAELVQQRENFRSDTTKIQQLHAEDAERWREETRKLKQEFNSSEEARSTLENIIQDHADREKRNEVLLADREELSERVKKLTEENEKVRSVVREMTDEMTHDPVVANAREQADKIVSLEADLARTKNNSLELDVRLQSCETELREERKEYEIRRQQHAETVKNLSSDLAMLRSMLHEERQRKSSFVDATLAGVSKWTVTAAGPTQGHSADTNNHNMFSAANYNNNKMMGTDHPASLRSNNNSFYNNNNNTKNSAADHQDSEQLEADAAAAVLADRLDTEALHHELSRLELVVSTQHKQLSELIGQRAQHVAQIADLKSMLEAISQDRQSLTEMNNALRNEARSAEAEVSRLQGEVAGLRGNLVRVRTQKAETHLQQMRNDNNNNNNYHDHQQQQPRRSSTSPTRRFSKTVAADAGDNNSSGSENHPQQQQQHAPRLLQIQKSNTTNRGLHVQGQSATNNYQHATSAHTNTKRTSTSGGGVAASASSSIYGRPVNNVSLANQPVSTNNSNSNRPSSAGMNNNTSAAVRSRGNMRVRNYAVED